MNNNNNSNNKKNIFSGQMNGASSVNYRSLSSLTPSSDQPIFRSVQHGGAQLSSPLDTNRGLMSTHQAKQSIPSNTQNIVVLTTQKESKTTSTTISDVKDKSTVDEVFVARDFPIIGFPLSQSYCVVSDPSKLDPAMKSISKSLKGQDKPSKGSIKATKENGTEIKVCAYRDTRTGKIYIEFNRLDGCAFIFQKAFIQAKLDASSYLDGVDPSTTKTELALIDKKLSFWYGQEPSSLISVLPEKTTTSA